MKTEWMMQELQRQAIAETLPKWEEAIRTYYRQGYDNGESVKLYKDLESMGADPEDLINREFEIREEILGI